jgi:uncharacterized membrane protein YkgB
MSLADVAAPAHLALYGAMAGTVPIYLVAMVVSDGPFYRLMADDLANPLRPEAHGQRLVTAWAYLAVAVELLAIAGLVLNLTATAWAIAAGVLLAVFTVETLAVLISDSTRELRPQATSQSER